jgi:hypothetical protein
VESNSRTSSANDKGAEGLVEGLLIFISDRASDELIDNSEEILNGGSSIEPDKGIPEMGCSCIEHDDSFIEFG